MNTFTQYLHYISQGIYNYVSIEYIYTLCIISQGSCSPDAWLDQKPKLFRCDVFPWATALPLLPPKNAITNPNRWNGSNLTRPSMLKRSATNPYKVRQPINCEMPGVESPTKLLP